MTTPQTRLAQADNPTRELLEEVYSAVFDKAPQRDYSRGWRFVELLDAEAWTSAVEMLEVPGWFTFYAAGGRHSGVWTWKLRGPNGQMVTAFANHRALALAIACLKARGL